MMPVAKIGARSWVLDPFLPYMKAAHAAVDRQVIAFAEVTDRLVPEVQGNTMFVSGTAMPWKTLPQPASARGRIN